MNALSPALPIFSIPPSLSNREYPEPTLISIPEGSGEQWERLCNSIRRRNRRALYPDGQD